MCTSHVARRLLVSHKWTWTAGAVAIFVQVGRGGGGLDLWKIPMIAETSIWQGQCWYWFLSKRIVCNTGYTRHCILYYEAIFCRGIYAVCVTIPSRNAHTRVFFVSQRKLPFHDLFYVFCIDLLLKFTDCKHLLYLITCLLSILTLNFIDTTPDVFAI